MSDRLSNGLTPEQDAAFDRLAEAIASLSPAERAAWAEATS